MKGQRIKCPECNHHQTSHYAPLTMSTRDVLCRAVKQGARICRCALTRDQVRRLAHSGQTGKSQE